MNEIDQTDQTNRNNPLVWAEVDLRAIAHNVRALCAAARPGARLMAVVKANGYGHGAVEVARTALANGAAALGVARIEEALPLRAAGIQAPVLVFGFTPPRLLPLAFQHALTLTVFSLSIARDYSSMAMERGKKLKLHLKLDTGMGRLGLLPHCNPTGFLERGVSEATLREVDSILRLPGLEVQGIYTHFAAADSADKSFARLQLERFLRFLERLERAGLEFAVRHAANSAALMELPDSHLDMVRPGIALYGLYPSAEVSREKIRLKPAMALKSRIVQVKEVPAGFEVSYGMTYRTERPTIIATVPLGYADGFDRQLSGRGSMLVRGQRVPVRGRVCMDLSMLDVGGVTGVEIGDEVVALGGQGESAISADELAASTGTINYEVVCRVSGRVPRVYLG